MMSIDADSGDAKWATQIPQGLDTGPGIDDRANRAYLPGDHSNLYLLNTRDGSCLESFYIGHRKGTISVPPVPLLGHVFVIENAGSDYANVHVLRVDDTGQSLRTAQAPFRLRGNVRVNPVIQGRRLIVLTDRGEVAVYDIEPTAERDQVTVAASLPAFYDEATPTQMAVGRTAMWITGTRVGRYELQINTGRVVRDWSMHELDTFIGQPVALGDTLVHSRMLRGTSAIRVTAAEPKTGEEIWRTDVGVPVAMIRPAPGGKGVHVVTSQASLFELGRESLASGSTQGPIENPGKTAVGIRFDHPVTTSGTGAVMVDQADGQSLLVYNPQRETEKLRQVTMQLGNARPSGGAIYAGKGLLLPLDSGRVALASVQTGGMIATPFQPASDPTKKIQWTVPVAMPNDANQVIVANSQKNIYRLRVAEQLRELSSKTLSDVLLGPTAGVGDTFFATAAGPAADFLIGLDMVSLDEKFKTLLDGRVAWGPAAAEDLCLLTTQDGKLRGFLADGTQKFQLAIPEGRPVGQPLLSNGVIVLAGESGWLIAIDPTDRKPGWPNRFRATDLRHPVPHREAVVGSWDRRSHLCDRRSKPVRTPEGQADPCLSICRPLRYLIKVSTLFHFKSRQAVPASLCRFAVTVSCLMAALICLAAPAIGQLLPNYGLEKTPEDPGLGLLQEESHDILFFTEKSGLGWVKVRLLDFPGRKPPSSPSGILKFDILGIEKDSFVAKWEDIRKVDLWEVRLERETKERIASGNFAGAYPFLSVLIRDYPNRKGLRKLRSDYLWNDAIARAKKGELGSTIAMLEELRQYAPEYKRSTVVKAFSGMADRLISQLVKEGKLNLAQQMLARLAKDYVNDRLPVVKKWKNQFHQLALAKQKKAIAARDTKDYRTALRLARESLFLEPEIEGGKALDREINQIHPVINVGVLQVATELQPTRIDNWAARRAGRLSYRTLFEIQGAGPEGGEYEFIFGDTEMSPDRMHFDLNLQPDKIGGPTQPSSQRLLGRCDGGPSPSRFS